MNSIHEAKKNLTVTQTWKLLGLPGRAVPGSALRSPFREDRNPSFAIFKSDQGWKDYGTGESGDQIDLIQKHFSCEKREAVRRFLDYTGAPMSLPPRKLVETKKEQPKWSFRLGTLAEIGQVATLRGLSDEAVQAAQDYGLLRFGIHRNEPAWIVTDKTGVNAQARRLDGGNWECQSGPIKAITLAGSQASWPLGTEEAREFQTVALVEGGPDLLAAFQAREAEGRPDVAVVAMLGAANKIPVEALPSFANKRVRVFPHSDEAGMRAGERWSAQLLAIGCDVDAFRFPRLKTSSGTLIKDFNDFLRIHPDDFELQGMRHGVMP